MEDDPRPARKPALFAGVGARTGLMENINFKSLNVLVVDDDSYILELLTIALRGLGIKRLTTATNGEEALRVYDGRADDIDVLLCDLNMPGMDGVEFIRHLAQRQYSGGIVMISGEDGRILRTAERLARAHNLNILGVLGKPMTRLALAEVLGRLGAEQAKGRQEPTSPTTAEEVRQGIQGDELVPFFQPKVEIATRRVVGVETLARWKHRERGMLGPDAFIPVAEQHGLINDLTDVIFAKAMKQGAAWRAAGLDLKVAVNISVDSLDRLELPVFILACASEYGMDASQVILEVTESRLMKNLTAALEILTRLSLKGIRLSIDDFGTGYSSMEQLQRLPFVELKIDKAFVLGAARDSAARAILESSVELGKKLSMTIVAEGVETQEDWDLVAKLGCDLVQGYFVAKPMPGENVREWITEWYLGGKSSS